MAWLHIYRLLPLLLLVVLHNALPMNNKSPHSLFDALYREQKYGDSDTSRIWVLLANKTLHVSEKQPEDGVYVATAWFSNKVNETGWSLLKVQTNGSMTNQMQAQAAGIAEGYITAEFIHMAYVNTIGSYCKEVDDYCKKLMSFIDSNNKWVSEQIKTYPNSAYWHQVGLINAQFQGMLEGYAVSKSAAELNLTDFELTLIQISGDLEDLEQALGKKDYKKVIGSGSCSALVKLFPNNEDLAISQVTWNDYNAMLRVYKLYNFTFTRHDESKEKIASSVQSFSSYPGLLFSGDDFYILDSQMVTQETTIGNSNADLWKYVQAGSVLEWKRTIVANRLAESGNEWVSMFERYNSGTYNNQWMVLDYKLFEAGKPIKPDTLWILEQLPGTVHMADMSLLLEKQGYWASYNLPYFPYIYNTSGVEASKQKFGSWFDYHENPRALIFERDHANVKDMQSMVKLMRYNNFMKDPLSKCAKCSTGYSAENAISARSDLNDVNGTYPFGSLGHRRHGATDVKATNARLAKGLAQFIGAGPTWDDQPAFTWSTSGWPRPKGHPDQFKFDPSLHDWKTDQWMN